MAIAAALNEMGYTAFVLFYRTKQDAVVAKAIEDMYACIRQIEARADEFEVQAGHYMIGGFSAGATLAGEIGSTNFGWKSAGVPKPEMIFLAYTAVRMKDFYAGYTQQINKLKDYQLILPIPQSVIDNNPGVITQNPNY